MPTWFIILDISVTSVCLLIAYYILSLEKTKRLDKTIWGDIEAVTRSKYKVGDVFRLRTPEIFDFEIEQFGHNPEWYGHLDWELDDYEQVRIISVFNNGPFDSDVLIVPHNKERLYFGEDFDGATSLSAEERPPKRIAKVSEERLIKIHDNNKENRKAIDSLCGI